MNEAGPTTPNAAGDRAVDPPAGNRRVLICGCPERHPRLDCERLAALVRAHGLAVETVQRLCRRETFLAVLDRLAEASAVGPLDLVIGACREALIGDLLRAGWARLAQAPRYRLIDLGRMADPEAFLGHCLVHFGIAAGLATTGPGTADPVTAGSDAAESATAGPAALIACSRPGPGGRPMLPRRADDPRRALVIGGGVSGCQAALDLARSGIPVSLVESDPALGGTMARLDKTFPTLDCAICILGPKLVETGATDAITLYAQSRVTRVSGRPGNFLVEILEQPRCVDMSKCSGCGTCMEVCPVIVPSPWNLGLKPGKAIGLVFEQAVPLRAVVQKDYCIDCGLCEQACERQAIDMAQQPRRHRLRVGAIVLAHGARSPDPARLGGYGYGRLPQVITNLELERVVCATGPTQGELITATGRVPRRVAFVHCAGSRNRRYLPYCSGFCCTAAIKEAMLVLEHCPDAEVTLFYNDIRTTGKNFESLTLRAQARGIRFVKALVARIEAAPGERAWVHYQPPGKSGHARWAADLVVLALGLEAAAAPIQWLIGDGPALDRYGFYQDRHPWSAPLDSTAPGIFLAGSCHGPRDITQTVTESSGAAARVIRFLERSQADDA